jgi:hypothetical protein
MKDHEEILNKSYKDKLTLLKTLLKDDFSTFLFVSNMYLSDKSISPQEFNKLFNGGLKRNYKFNKQQND